MTKSVLWSSCSRLSCSSMESPDVVLCLTSSSLLSVNCPRATLDAVLTKNWKDCNGCNTPAYRYLFSYDERLLADPSTALTTADIVGVFCKGCLTDWITDEIRCQAGALCVVDTITLDAFIDINGCIGGNVKVSLNANNILSIADDGLYVPAPSATCLADTESLDLRFDDSGCITGNVLVSADPGNIIETRADGLYATAGGGGGDDWHILGNSGTVDGTNFLGTTDNVAFEARVNNIRAVRIFPALDSNGGADIIMGYALNSIDAPSSGQGNGILSGGYKGFGANQNTITEDANTVWTEESVICGGIGNNISGGFASFIGGGYGNICVGNYNSIVTGLLNTLGIDVVNGSVNSIICGGEANSLDGDSSFIGGGGLVAFPNTIVNGGFTTLVGGAKNSITDGPFAFNGITPLSQCSFIGGGGSNTIFFDGSFTPTGTDDGFDSILGGKLNNITNSILSTIGGGGLNTIQLVEGVSASDFIGGGDTNLIEDANYACILGGKKNVNIGDYSTILGGHNLTLSLNSVGYQADTADGDTSRNLAAFTHIAYFGDVDLWVGNTLGTARKLKLFEPNTDTDYSSANYTSHQAQAQGANIEYVWPAAAGVANQVLTIDTVVGTVVTLKWA